MLQKDTMHEYSSNQFGKRYILIIGTSYILFLDTTDRVLVLMIPEVTSRSRARTMTPMI